MLEVAREQVADVGRVERAAHALGRAVDRGAGGREVVLGRRPARKRGRDLGAALAADLEQQPMLAVEDLREREVVVLVGLRAGAHRDAEARGRGLEAVGGHDEGVLPACGVVAIGVAAAEQHAILDRDPVQLAGAHAEKRERRRIERLLLHLEPAVPGAPRPEQLDARRKQELLPRVRADRVAEARVVVAALEAIRPGLLDVGPADGQLGRGFEIVVDDRALPHLAGRARGSRAR